MARLLVRLTPSGGADRIDGVVTGPDDKPILKARVRAAPEKGQANAALEALLAKALSAPKSSVRVARGAAARVKQVEIDNLDEAALAAFLAAQQQLAS